MWKKCHLWQSVSGTVKTMTDTATLRGKSATMALVMLQVGWWEGECPLEWACAPLALQVPLAPTTCSSGLALLLACKDTHRCAAATDPRHMLVTAGVLACRHGVGEMTEFTVTVAKDEIPTKNMTYLHFYVLVVDWEWLSKSLESQTGFMYKCLFKWVIRNNFCGKLKSEYGISLCPWNQSKWVFYFACMCVWVCVTENEFWHGC